MELKINLKTKNMEAVKTNLTVGINLELPREFSIELDRHLIDLKEQGQNVTKANLIIQYAKAGLKEAKGANFRRIKKS